MEEKLEKGGTPILTSGNIAAKAWISGLTAQTQWSVRVQKRTFAKPSQAADGSEGEFSLREWARRGSRILTAEHNIDPEQT